LISGTPGRAENSSFTTAEQEQLRISISQIRRFFPEDPNGVIINVLSHATSD